MGGMRKPIMKAEYGIAEVETKKIEKYSVNSDALLSALNNDIAYRKDYPIKMLDDLLDNSMYANLCIENRVEGSIKKGYNTIEDKENNLIATDKFFIDNIDIQEIAKVSEDYLKYGERYIEAVVYNHKVVSLYNMPVATMSNGINSKNGLFFQHAGTDKEKVFPKFDFDLHKLGKHPDGNFVIYSKRGNKTYGVPFWISAIPVMKAMKEQNRTIHAFFENDAEPEKVFVWYNVNVNTKSGAEFKKNREKEYQGSDKRGKTEHVFLSLPKATSGDFLDIKTVEKKIVTKENLDLIMRNKFDIVALFRVPHFLVGLNKAAELGSGGQYEVLLWFYISEVLQPEQRYYYDLFRKLFGDLPVQFNTMQMPKLSQRAVGNITNMEVAKSKLIEDNIKLKLGEVYENYRG